MSLPPGFLDELRNRVSLSAVVGRKVTWDMRKSNMAKGDWWAPCPFHQEKSASFHVDDRKGFYYCFGCHAKGDALTFVKESENLSFLEAVAVLAGEAGMPMPERDAQAAQKADRLGELRKVMEEAVKFYRLQLKTGAAAPARDYLAKKRGLSEVALERWEIGWAPDSRQALIGALAAKGISQDLMVASGMVAKADDGSFYDRFRGRIIFPIQDARGRAISLGGRSMDPNARAKYLNGPETELFDKGRNLYNHAPAREAVGKGAALVVAEGYMDVIALCEAGFGGAVAPLGTAVTEDQLRLMWRISDEPVIALDGDAAGVRAALRVVDLALPLLEAGRGLRFALLPQGQDPDELIKAAGPAAMRQVIETAQPMVRLLWQRETEGKVFDSPERRAALDKTLREALKRIADPSIRAHYGEEIKELRRALFFPRRPAPPPGAPRPRYAGRGVQVPAMPTQGTKTADFTITSTEETREAIVLATLILFPNLLNEFETQLERLEFSTSDHLRLRNLLLTHSMAADPREAIRQDSRDALERLLARNHIARAGWLRAKADDDYRRQEIAFALAYLQTDRAHRAELAEAEQDVTGLADEGLTWRLTKASEARARASRGPKEQKGETVIAPNGVELDREELDRARKLLDSIDFSKGSRRSP